MLPADTQKASAHIHAEAEMLEFRFLFIGSRLLLIDFSGHRQEKPVPGGCGLAIHGQSTAFMSAVKGGTTRMAAKRPQQPYKGSPRPFFR